MCDWFAILVILIGCSNYKPAKLRKRDNYTYIKQNCLWVLPKNLLSHFKLIVADVKVAPWTLWSVCANANVIGIYNLEINPVYKDTEDLSRKTRYMLDGSIEKNSFKLVYF